MLLAYGLLIVNVLLLVSGQLLWKSAVDGINNWDLSVAIHLILSPKVILGVLFYAVATGIWLYILSKLPFSVAYPFQSLSYVLGVILAAFYFHENVTGSQWFGVFSILVGVYFVAK